MHRSFRGSIRVVRVAALALFGLTALPLWASDCEFDSAGHLRLELAPLQERLECRFRNRPPGDVYVTGPGKVRVTFFLETSTEALEQLIISDVLREKRYRTVLFAPRSKYFETGVTNLEGYPDAYPEIDRSEGTVGEPYEFVVILEILVTPCNMYATVGGDVAGSYFGDVAYFNTAEYAVKKGMMVGTIGETQAHEDVEGFGTFELAESPDDALALAAELGLIDEEEEEQAAQDLEEEGEEEPEEEPRGFAEWLQQELQADDPAEGDNFGLNLIDVKTDVTFDGDPGATVMFASTFTLTLSGRADFDQGPMEESAPLNVTIRPSTLTATVGLSDKGGDRIPFEMQEGDSVEIYGSLYPGDLIVGTLKGELQTKGVYTLEGEGAYTREGVAYTPGGEAISPRKLKISVEAEFMARRGSLSCMQ